MSKPYTSMRGILSDQWYPSFHLKQIYLYFYKQDLFFFAGGGTPHIDPTRLVNVCSALRKFNPKENMIQKTSEFQRQSRLGIISYFKLFISLSSSVVKGGNVSKVQILPFGLQNPFFPWQNLHSQHECRAAGELESNPSSPFTPNKRARLAVFFVSGEEEDPHPRKFVWKGKPESPEEQLQGKPDKALTHREIT